MVLTNVVYSQVAIVNHDFPLVVLVKVQFLVVGRDLDVTVNDGFQFADEAFLVDVQRKTLLDSKVKMLQILYFDSHFNIIIRKI